MGDEESFKRWVRENPLTAEHVGARAALDLIGRLRRELLAAYDRIEAQKELLARNAEKKGR